MYHELAVMSLSQYGITFCNVQEFVEIEGTGPKKKNT